MRGESRALPAERAQKEENVDATEAWVYPDRAAAGGKHQTGANYGYADGHVKFVKSSPRTCRNWTPHPAVENLVIPGTNDPPAGACRLRGQGTGWCTANLF